MEPIIKYNGGKGAILCNDCCRTLKEGLTQKEFGGNTDLFLCNECKITRIIKRNYDNLINGNIDYLTFLENIQEAVSELRDK